MGNMGILRHLAMVCVVNVLNAALCFFMLPRDEARVEISFYKPLFTHTKARHYQLCTNTMEPRTFSHPYFGASIFLSPLFSGGFCFMLTEESNFYGKLCFLLIALFPPLPLKKMFNFIKFHGFSLTFNS